MQFAVSDHSGASVRIEMTSAPRLDGIATVWGWFCPDGVDMAPVEVRELTAIEFDDVDSALTAAADVVIGMEMVGQWAEVAA